MPSNDDDDIVSARASDADRSPLTRIALLEFRVGKLEESSQWWASFQTKFVLLILGALLAMSSTLILDWRHSVEPRRETAISPPAHAEHPREALITPETGGE